MSWSYNPSIAETTLVWANPVSLATTPGITFVFSSSGYLDVSVHRVCHHLPIYSGAVTLAGGFPHSDISGSKLIYQLPETFRRLSRPSSPVIAKAFTICTYSLDPITLKPEPFLNSNFVVHETPAIGFLKQLHHHSIFRIMTGLFISTSSSLTKLQSNPTH